MKIRIVVVGLMCVVGSVMARQALAVPPSPDVAKLCRQKAIDAHPTLPAGSERGSAQAQRDFFRDCVARMQQEKKSR